jgi:UDP-N-acetyl-D-glucosamine dehydrogenase
MSVASAYSQLQERIAAKTALVGVIGMGYVGLPLIDAFIQVGYQTLGFDIDETKVERLNAGTSYIAHMPSERVQQWLQQGHFTATSRQERLQDADAILICVPTPLTVNRDPDLSYVEATARQIAAHLRKGQLIVLESTTYPGTTRELMLPILSETGLKVGEDFFLAYSPEREDPGNAKFRAKSIPKVVGGYDEPSRKLAVELYAQAVVKVVPVSNCEVAEACKILENTYRAVNIALVNELKMLYDQMGIDVWEVIEAAKTKPFGYQAFYPGPGLGGHCIPIDPFYLSWVARKYNTSTRFIELAGEVNASMPRYVIERLGDALNEQCKSIRGSQVLILGMAYKKDVDDARESPGFELLELLLQKGANVSYNDPHIPILPRTRHYPTLHMESVPLSSQFLAKQDCVLIATDHSTYDYAWIAKHSKLVVDTRNATKKVSQCLGKVWKA